MREHWQDARGAQNRSISIMGFGASIFNGKHWHIAADLHL
jgi:hypothetical protein